MLYMSREAEGAIGDNRFRMLPVRGAIENPDLIHAFARRAYYVWFAAKTRLVFLGGLQER